MSKSDPVKQHDQYKLIRQKYPESLSDQQIQELVDIFPSKPLNRDVISLALSHGYDFNESEIKLYWKYQAKLMMEDAKESVAEHGDVFDKYLAKSQGMFLKQMVYQVFSELGQKSKEIEDNFEKYKSFATELFRSWRSEIPHELFELQKVGFIKGIEINKKIFGETRMSRFLEELIK